eukprot:490840_1
MCYFLSFNVCCCLLLGLADNFYNDIWLTSTIANIILVGTGFGIGYIETFWLLNKFNIDPLSLSKLNGNNNIDLQEAIQLIHKQIFDQSRKISHAVAQEIIDENMETNMKTKMTNVASLESDNTHSQNSTEANSTTMTDTIFLDSERIKYFDDVFITQVDSSKLLCKIISNGKLYDLFLIHLTKEYNSECILALTEFVQFKQWLLFNISNNDKYKDREITKYKNDNDKCISIFEGSIPLSLPTSM